jgi:hypothetical protein
MTEMPFFLQWVYKMRACGGGGLVSWNDGRSAIGINKESPVLLVKVEVGLRMGDHGRQHILTDVRVRARRPDSDASRPAKATHPIVLQKRHPLKGKPLHGHRRPPQEIVGATISVQIHVRVPQFRPYMLRCDRSRSNPHSTHHSSAASIAK